MGILDDMFTNDAFRRSANNGRLWFGTKDDIKYGVCLANEWHGNRALNQDSLDAVLAAKAAAKIDVAMVVEADVNTENGTRTLIYKGERDAGELRAVLARETLRIGRFGKYWVRASFVNDDDPF
jgi:hypothetical protein